jgi:predicted methyltransferase
MKMNKIEFEQKVSEVANDLELRDLDIFCVLAKIATEGDIEKSKLIAESGFPKTNLLRLLTSFKEVLEPPSTKVIVKKRDRDWLRTAATTLVNKIKYRSCQSEIEQKIVEYGKLKPTPNRNYDQFFATEETTARRSIEMANNGDLYNRNVAFLGDDDLTSIAVALVGQTKRVVVFEIDEGIAGTISRIANKLGLSIEIIKQDLRKSASGRYDHQFNTVFTDPPYTNAGVSMFTNRAIELLKNKLTSRLYLCYGNSDRARERELEVQKIIINKGMLINAKHFQFNKYRGGESIGSSSSLYLLDWTPKTRTTSITGKFYTND